MKKRIIQSVSATMFLGCMVLCSCTSPGNEQETVGATASAADAAPAAGQSAVEDNVSQKDVVKVAVASKDHSTLVAAVKAANYVDVLSNAGPFTVFAPTNDAFAQLPAGTVDELLKPEKQNDLRNILEYHVYVGVLKPEDLTDGRVLNMVNLDNAEIKVADGKQTINGAAILASVPASNGIIYVVDKVLLPPAKK